MSSGIEAYFSKASLPLPISADAQRVRQKSASVVMALPLSGKCANAGRPRSSAVGEWFAEARFQLGRLHELPVAEPDGATSGLEEAFDVTATLGVVEVIQQT